MRIYKRLVETQDVERGRTSQETLGLIGLDTLLLSVAHWPPADGVVSQLW